VGIAEQGWHDEPFVGRGRNAMKGVVLLVVGAALIWLGVLASESPSKAGGGEDPATARPEEPDEDSPAAGEPRAELATPVALAAEREPEDAGGARAAGSPEDPPLARGADGARSSDEVEGSTPAPVAPAADLESAGTSKPSAPRTDPVAAPVPEAAPDPPQAGGRDPSIELTARTEDSALLAQTLLEAWIATDPQALEAHLNDPARDVPPGRRRLVAAFWQAVVGSPDVAFEGLAALEGEQGVSTAQLELLRAAGDPAPDRPVPAAAGRRDPLARAMRMVLLQDRAARASSAGEHALAARSWSDLIQLELEAEWPPHRPALLEWADGLRASQTHHRLDPGGDWPSRSIEVLANDSLSAIRSRLLQEDPRLCLCVELLRRLNGVGKFIHPGQTLRAPTDPPNVLVDLDARFVVYRHGEEAVLAWECGIGKEGHDTPAGTYQIGMRLEEPSHMPDGGPQLPYGHPDNPLGTRWLAWYQDGQKTTYGFHGTPDPLGVGGRVSQGCVRMRNEEVEELYDLLPVGATVVVRP